MATFGCAPNEQGGESAQLDQSVRYSAVTEQFVSGLASSSQNSEYGQRLMKAYLLYSQPYSQGLKANDMYVEPDKSVLIQAELDALEVLKRAERDFPKNYEAYYLEGLIEYGSGDLQAMVDAFNKAGTLGSDSLFGEYWADQILFSSAKGNVPQAMELWENARNIIGDCDALVGSRLVYSGRSESLIWPF